MAHEVITPASGATTRPKVSVLDFKRMKARGDAIVLVTAYDAPSARLADEAGVECILVGDSAAMTVMGHDSRLGQVVRNLIDNARSFTKPGSKLQVRVRRVGPDVEFRVDDFGPGIPPDNLQRVFERFYTDRPHQGFGQNSGLGLSISKQIVEAHGGRIWADARPGEGATFWFTLS